MNGRIDTLERELVELAYILKAVRDDVVAMNRSFEQFLADWDNGEDEREHADWEAIN